MNTPFTIGVAGHVDHGKTTLVKAMTGIDTDRKTEEKTRGLSIETGVAELKLPGGQSVALIDVPGHTDFLKNTIRGLNSVDMALLVVAVDDGVMPQTSEHLEILKFFKANTGFVVLTKTDLVDSETIELAELEMNELLKGTFLENCPIFKFTHRKAELCTDIVREIDHVIAHATPKKKNEPFRMWVDQVNRFPGHGTVVSGTIASGIIHTNDEIELLPRQTKLRARSLQSHGHEIDQAVAGQRVGINLHRISIHEVRRGMSLTVPVTIQPTYMLNTHIGVLNTANKGIKNRQRVKIYLGTSITNGMVVLMGHDHLEPGEIGLTQIRLMKPIAALPQDSFVISPLNMNTVIAGGRVLEIPQEKYRAVKSKSILPALSALRDTDIHSYVDLMFANAMGRFITADDLSQKTGLPHSAFERLISSKVQKEELIYFKGHGAIRKSYLSELKKEIITCMENAFKKDPLKKNIGLSEINNNLEYPVDEILLRFMADSLCETEKIERYEGGYILANSENRLDTKRGSLILRLLDYARFSELTPFSADTFWKLYRPQHDKAEISQLLDFLYSRNKLARLNDKRFLSLEAVEEIKRRVAHMIRNRGFIQIKDCKELLGYGRWGGTHVLDYLNQIGFTVRREDKHYLKKDET